MPLFRFLEHYVIGAFTSTVTSHNAVDTYACMTETIDFIIDDVHLD